MAKTDSTVQSNGAEQHLGSLRLASIIPAAERRRVSVGHRENDQHHPALRKTATTWPAVTRLPLPTRYAAIRSIVPSSYGTQHR